MNSTRKTAIQLAAKQLSILNKIKRQEQEKRKLNQERNVEQKKLKKVKKLKINQSSSQIDEINKGTLTSKLKIILNDNDQIDKMNNRLIRKYKETNNRMVSFKDRLIQTNSTIKRVNNEDACRLAHKKRVK